MSRGVNFTVLTANIDADSNNDGQITHADDDPIEDAYPGACLARYSSGANNLAEVFISSMDVTVAMLQNGLTADELYGTLTFSGAIRVWADGAGRRRSQAARVGIISTTPTDCHCLFGWRATRPARRR